MAITTGPRRLVENLIFSVDAANVKCWGDVNYLTYSNYRAGDWGNFYPANTTITTDIDAPDGTNTAVRVTCANTGPSLVRILFPNFTANGGDYWTTSFYARLISGTGPGLLYNDLQDGQPGKSYANDLIANTWVRIQQTAIPSAGAKNFFDLISDSTQNYVVDFWGAQIEPGREASRLTATTGTVKTQNANVASSLLKNITLHNAFPYGGTYWSANPERFETTATTITANTGILVSPTISFADTSEYTLEFWVKMRSGAPATSHSLSGRNPTGTGSWILIDNLNTTGNSWRIRYRDYAAAYLTFPTVTSPNIQTSWVHIVVAVSSNRNVTVYINGTENGTLAAATTRIDISRIASGYESGGNYFTLQGAMAIARVHSARLTANEIADSYRSDRNRFGLT
jgi:hypothetical protein